MRASVLIAVDRDGTLIQNDGFFAQDDNWEKNLKLNENVVELLEYIQKNYQTTTIVLTNQSGVARGLFPTRRVEEVNQLLDKILKKRGITIDNWQYCSYVDMDYAKKHPEINWNTKFIKKITKRKPSPQMLLDGLKELGKRLNDFKKLVVIGDHEDDRGVAKNINAKFIDVTSHLSAWRKML